jgi:hypothetical protein
MIGGGSGVKTGLILAYLGFAVPFFWRDRRSWLLLAVAAWSPAVRPLVRHPRDR